MASTLETLVVRLTADATKLEQELNKQVRNAETAGAKIRAGLRLGAQAFAVLGTAAVGAGTALTALVQRTAAYADEVDKAAIRTRLARSTVQELRFVADQAGGSFQAVEQNIRAFTGRIAEAERGSQTLAGTFNRLGVALKDSQGNLRDTESLFLDTLNALSGVENETERAALAVSAFGETASELLPIISQGAGGIDDLREKARELGLVLDDQRIGALVQYKDAVSRIGLGFEAVQREISIGFLPILKDGVVPVLENFLIPRLRDAVTDLFGLETAFDNSGVATDEFRQKLADIAASVVTFGDILLDLGRIALGVAELLTAPFAALGSLIGGLSVDLGRFSQAFDDAWESVPNWQRGSALGQFTFLRNLAPAFKETIGASFSGAFEAGLDQYLSALDTLGAGFSGLGDLSPGEAARQAVLNGAFTGGGSRNTPGTYNPTNNTGAGGTGAGGTTGPFPVASSLNRQLEDAGTVGRGVVLAAQEQAAKDAAAWVANRLAITSASLRADEDAGTVGRAETTAMLDEKKADAERALGAWWANRFAVTQRSLRLDEDAGTMGRAESNSIAEARAAAAAAEAEQAAVDFMLLRLQATTASFRQSEDAGTVGRAETNAILEEKKAEANRAIGEWFAMRIALVTAGLRADEDAGTMGRAAFMAFEPGWKSRAALAGKPGSPFDGSWRARGSGGKFTGDLSKPGRDAEVAAANAFAETVAGAAFTFTENLIGAIRSGDIGEAFRAALGAGQGILGSANLGTIPFMGGSLGIGALLSGVLGIFAALIPRGAGESEATRALGANTRGAPAVEFNVTVNQSLSIASLTGEGRRAVDGLLNDTASRIEAVITRNVLPRLGYLEERIA